MQGESCQGPQQSSRHTVCGELEFSKRDWAVGSGWGPCWPSLVGMKIVARPASQTICMPPTPCTDGRCARGRASCGTGDVACGVQEQGREVLHWQDLGSRLEAGARGDGGPQENLCCRSGASHVDYSHALAQSTVC